VCALLLHEMKALKPAYRLKLFFVASAILRQSKSRRGERDKYGACLHMCALGGGVRVCCG